jgi:hypothetical protein
MRLNPCQKREVKGDVANCGECGGTGFCDACSGYGTSNESYPGAGDEAECEVCFGDGQCVECLGIGEIPDHVFESAGE